MRAVIVLHHYLDLPLADVAATPRDPRSARRSRACIAALGQMRAALDADARAGSESRKVGPA